MNKIFLVMNNKYLYINNAKFISKYFVFVGLVLEVILMDMKVQRYKLIIYYNIV